jgi:hypothetical protein
VTTIQKVLSKTIGFDSATLMLAACYPHPHEYTSIPAISGVLLNAGKPVREPMFSLRGLGRLTTITARG